MIVEATVDTVASPLTVVETKQLSKADTGHGSDDYTINFSVEMEYAAPGQEDSINVVANTKLKFRHTVEDTSFSYSYGSENGVHGGEHSMLELVSFTEVSVPHNRDNYDLFRQSPEVVARITTAVHTFLENMGEDEIEKYIDIEKIAQQITDSAKYDNY